MTDDQLEMFPTPPPTNPLREGFKCIYGGIFVDVDGTRHQSYIAIFADHATYASDNPSWLEDVATNIAQQTTRPIDYVLHVYDSATAKTYSQGIITNL